jgi:dihydropteroate synthase
VDHLIVRIEDAHLVSQGAPGCFVVSRLPEPEAVAERVATAGGNVLVAGGGRLRAVVTPQQLINAAGRVDPQLGHEMEQALVPAVDAWQRPPTTLTLRDTELSAAARPLIMGIVNVTPDSFSDGGVAWSDDDHPGPALEHARRLVESGADLLDIGGESTRPGAAPVDVAEELRRVIPVVEACADLGRPMSIDTSKAAVAAAAIDAGAAIVNDVSAGSLDPDLLATVAERQVPYVLMHMRGTPRTMQDDTGYEDVVAEVYEFLADTLQTCRDLGIAQVVVDPGIGFGKGTDDNLRLLGAVRQFAGLGCPVLVGASRKSFIGAVSGVDDPGDRVFGSVGVASVAAASGAAILRVHDVAETRQAVALASAITRGQATWTASD